MYDNTPDKSRILELSNLSKSGNVTVIANGVNDGMAKAINKQCLIAKRRNFEFCCFLDQDSIFDKSSITSMISLIENYDNDNVSIFAPKIVYDHKNRKSNKEPKLEFVKWCITSGSFVNLGNFFDIGGMDEAFFIDRLEYDYCVRAGSLGYKVVQNNRATLFQSLGEVRKVAFFRFSEHSALRNYYITRNRLYYYFTKRKDISISRLLKVFLITVFKVIRIIILESNKFLKVRFLVRAHIDFFLNRMGRY